MQITQQEHLMDSVQMDCALLRKTINKIVLPHTEFGILEEILDILERGLIRAIINHYKG